MEKRGVCRLEAETVTWARVVWADASIADDRRAIERHLFNAYVVVQPLNVAQFGNGTRCRSSS
jgi:hypothetical protein